MTLVSPRTGLLEASSHGERQAKPVRAEPSCLTHAQGSLSEYCPTPLRFQRANWEDQGEGGAQTFKLTKIGKEKCSPELYRNTNPQELLTCAPGLESQLENVLLSGKSLGLFIWGEKKTVYKLHMELMELNFFSSDHTIENKNKVDLNVYLTQYIKNIILKCYKYFKIPRQFSFPFKNLVCILTQSISQLKFNAVLQLLMMMFCFYILFIQYGDACTFAQVCVHGPQRTCTAQRITCRSWFSPSTLQIPETELCLLGSVADSFIRLSHLPWGGDNQIVTCAGVAGRGFKNQVVFTLFSSFVFEDVCIE